MLLKVDYTLHQDKAGRMGGITHAGQAHFAGTGPNETCRTCTYFMAARKKSGPCAKYRHLTGRDGPKVPETAMACKYWELIPK